MLFSNYFVIYLLFFFFFFFGGGGVTQFLYMQKKSKVNEFACEKRQYHGVVTEIVRTRTRNHYMRGKCRRSVHSSGVDSVSHCAIILNHTTNTPRPPKFSD